ncbi:NAD(+) synthase [Gryllotalpicola ginsengisoli]|uniref:NAD(+) synthase n=1 Tax=Gryllotalpicola ginsengisoli TaxID=444608 RepID=UPI0003B72862|nr:NAD(+) synthase [Gryllotalpicola ginsengisoli]
MTDDWLGALGAYAHGFARVAAATFPIAIADPVANADRLLAQARELHDRAVGVAVFTELCLSGYAIDDLVLQDPVLDAVDEQLGRIADASRELLPVLVVGAPLRHGTRLYNCAVVIHRGEILGVAPKAYLPTYREFYERRWYAPGDDQRGGSIAVAGRAAPFGTDLLFEASDLPGLVLHVEVCEDMWVPIPPSAEAALAGATVLANLSGSPITIGRADERELLAASASARCLAAYVYAAAGMGESSNDLSWDGQTLVYERGTRLAATDRFPDGPRAAVADIDLDVLRQERIRQGTFDDNRRTHADRIAGFRTVRFELAPPRGEIGLERQVDRYPFVPDDPARLAQDCYEAYNIQVSGLEQRMAAIGGPKLVIGVSGGLDSTHALLVCAQAMDRLGRPRSDILAFTMPGFATSDATKANATALAHALGVTFEELDIKPAATELLSRLGHPFAGGEPVYDVTFENVQAGLRTDFLFRIANQRGGIVVGTGDLSEFALGWATYGVGDQMSHYAVNTGVPKTLMQHLIRWVSGSGLFSGEVSEILDRVLGTEITPELVPVGEDGEAQSTEKTIGPYALHDFALYYVLRYGLRPSKIAWLASWAWNDAASGEWPPGFPDDAKVAYTTDEIVHWLEVFLKRFFGFAQFKRSAMPNGPKVAAGGSLSPRGDWRAPSDSSPRAWLDELRAAYPRGA